MSPINNAASKTIELENTKLSTPIDNTFAKQLDCPLHFQDQALEYHLYLFQKIFFYKQFIGFCRFLPLSVRFTIKVP